MSPALQARRSILSIASGLRAKLLFAFLVVGLAPLISLGVFATGRADSDLTEAAGLRLESVAHTAGETIDRALEARWEDTRNFAHTPFLEFDDQLTTALNTIVDSYDQYDLVVIAGLDGTVLATNDLDHTGTPIDTSSIIGSDVSGEAWFVGSVDAAPGTVAADDAAINPLLAEIHGDDLIGLTFTAPFVSPGGERAGVFHSVVSFDRTAAEIMREVEHDLQAEGIETAEAVIINSDGLILQSSHPEDIFHENLIVDGIDAAAQAVMPGGLGYTIEPDVHGGDDLVYGFSHADGADDFAGHEWGIVIEQNVNEATASATALRNNVVTFVLITAALVVVGGFLLARSVARPVVKISDRAERITGGDLSGEPLAMKRKDEIGNLANAFDSMTESLTMMVERLRASSGTLNEVSGQLNDASDGMSRSAEETSEQASSASSASTEVSTNVTSIAAAVEEMNNAIAEVASSASRSATVAAEAVEVALITSDSISLLGESSQEIGEVIDVIESIAEQTNLLALNATIEAARAGDAGKGFAVVASEVKDLATQTSHATTDIAERIASIQAATKDAVANTERVRETIDQISDISSTIAAAVEEQSATSGEIGRAIEEAAISTDAIAQSITELADAAQQTHDASVQGKESAGAMTDVAHGLTELAGAYR